MAISVDTIKPGNKLISPGGRHLVVSHVIVPKHTPEVSVPSRFRNYSRKMVLFQNNSITTLADIQQHYRLAS